MTNPAAWQTAAEAAAAGHDWPETIRIIDAMRDEWPEEPEFLLAAADWLRMAGLGDRANDTLRRAARLEDNFGIAEEARILEISPEIPPPPPHPATTLLDIQDLLQFLHETGSVSGIQRVQLGIIAAVLEGEAGALGEAALAVFPSLANGGIWAPRAEDMRELLAYCSGAKRDVALARRLVARLRARALRITATPGAGFVVLGAHWFFAGAPGYYHTLRQQGLRLGVLIYDMFPATHPEYTTTDTTSYFNQSLNEGLFFWDFAFAISEYSAEAFRRIAAERGYPAIETVAIPLAHSFGLRSPRRPGWLQTWPSALGDLEGRDYVVSVSTIEARKNHLLLFHAWQRMIEQGDNPPPLVLVGRPGWRVGDFMGQLDATRYLNGRILVVHGLSDSDLEAVYRGCLFTVMPSFAEGWGLAVGESLSFGRPCIAANTSALPEVGGDLVTYADPLSVPEWVAAMRAWLNDRPALEAMGARIAREFRPRRWPEVAEHLLREAERLRHLPARLVPMPAAPLRLKLGEEFPAGIAVATRGADADANRLTLAQARSLESGWYPAEAGCTWMRGRHSCFTASTDGPPGSPVMVTVQLDTTHRPVDNRVTLAVPGGPSVGCAVPLRGPFFLSAAGLLDEDGTLRFQLLLDRPAQQHGADPRQLCVSFQMVTIRPADAAALAPPQTAPEPEPEPEPEPQPEPAAPRRALPRLRLPGLALIDATRRLLKQANDARDAGDWISAAALYAAYLERRPDAAAIHVQRGNMLSMAGEHAAALESLTTAQRLGDPNAAQMLALAEERARPAPEPGPAWEGARTVLDISALLAPPPGAAALALLGHGLSPAGWGARQWWLGLTQALMRKAEGQVIPALRDVAAGQLRALSRHQAQALLAAGADGRRAMLDDIAPGLPVIAPARSDRFLVLGPGPGDAALRRAREAGARVTLVLAEPLALTQPHRVAPDLAAALQASLLAPHAAYDGLLLAMPNPGAAAVLRQAGRHGLAPRVLPAPAALPQAPTGGAAPDEPYILADGAPPWLLEAWMLLRETETDLPALRGLDGGAEAVGMRSLAGTAAPAVLIAGARLALATGLDGAWPALAIAAGQARRPCLETDALDPLDARATARAIAALLRPEARAMRLAEQEEHMAGADWPSAAWDAVAEAALDFEDAAANDALPPPLPPVIGPAPLQQGWALAASRGAAARGAA